MKHSPIFGLRALVSGSVISLAALFSVTAVSTSAIADSHEMATNIAIAADQLQWAPLGEQGAQVAVLWGDPAGDDFGIFIKIPPGFSPGRHSHTGDYHGINVTGNWVHISDGNVHALPQGSYVKQLGGEVHNDACAGPGDCILFIHQHTPQDFIPAGGTGE